MSKAGSTTIRANRAVCMRSGHDGPAEIELAGSRIVGCRPSVVIATGESTNNGNMSLWLPGLVDLHAHPAKSGSKYGVDPDREFLPRGVTTVLSQGDAGASNYQRFIEETIHTSRARVRLAINLARFGEVPNQVCFHDSETVDIDRCVDAIQRCPDLIWGIAVNVSRNSCQIDPRAVTQAAREVARQTGKPLLRGLRNPTDWSLAAQLEELEPGDVVTYFLRAGEWSVVDSKGTVRSEVKEARNRGVLFDACHGAASFSFRIAEALINNDFLPDTISSDQYRIHVGSQPQLDLPLVMSKFAAVGMREHDIFARVGVNPAKILDLDHEVGALTNGMSADITELVSSQEPETLVDCYGEQRIGKVWRANRVICRGVAVNSDKPSRSS